MTLNYPVFYLAASILISLAICLYAWHHPQARGSKAFALACLAFVIWTTGDLTVRISENSYGHWAGEAIRFTGACFLPVVLFIFVRQYCRKPLSGKWIAVLCVVPLLSLLIMLTNDWHSLFFKSIKFFPGNPREVEYGIYFWTIHLPYCYILTFIAFAAVLLERRRASRHFRTQLSILLFAMSIPVIVNIVGVFKLIGDRGYTALSFPIFFSIMAFAIFRYQFLVGNPIAYETVFQTIRDGVIIFDPNDTVIDINPAAAELLGKKSSNLAGLDFNRIFAPQEELFAPYRHKNDFYDEIEMKMDERQYFISVSITPLETGDGQLDGRIFTLRDITAHKQHQLSLETLAFQDPLTRLANRYRFQEEVEKAIAAAKENGGCFTILYFDLNRFKAVNDTFGHEAGDELLKYVGARTASILRQPDLAARLGGDEFTVLLHNCDQSQIAPVIERIIENVCRPFKVGDQTLSAELSIGAAFYPRDGETLAELLRSADAAMYLAKQKKCVFIPAANEIQISNELNM